MQKKNDDIFDFSCVFYNSLYCIIWDCNGFFKHSICFAFHNHIHWKWWQTEGIWLFVTVLRLQVNQSFNSSRMRRESLRLFSEHAARKIINLKCLLLLIFDLCWNLVEALKTIVNAVVRKTSRKMVTDNENVLMNNVMNTVCLFHENA